MCGWLCDTNSWIYISFNIWTSNNSFAIIGIYGHFVSGYTVAVRSMLLALWRIERNHSGEEVSLILIDIIKFWRLEACLSIFVGDNSEVNNVVIEKVLEVLRPNIYDSK